MNIKMLQVITPKDNLLRFALDSVLMYEITTVTPKKTKFQITLKPVRPRAYGGNMEEGERFTVDYQSREQAEAAISIVEL